MRVRTFVTVAAALALLTSVGVREARAGFSLGQASQFVVLGAVANNTNFEIIVNSNAGGRTNIVGDIGLGSPRPLTFTTNTGAQVVGNVRFSGAANSTNMDNTPPTGQNVFGNIVTNDAVVTGALTTIANLSSTLQGEAGTAVTISGNQTITASNGILDAGGNRVFTATLNNFDAGEVLTISGTASEFVVINIPNNDANINGRVVLTGGITSDHVLFNATGGNLNIRTQSTLATAGTYINFGQMTIIDTTLYGRFFGGESNKDITITHTSIVDPLHPIPEPGTLLLLGSGLFLIGRAARRRRTRVQ